LPSYRIADAQRPRNVPQRFGAQRGGTDPNQRRAQRDRVIASLLAVPGKGGRANGLSKGP
jgi:hypothetical protein